nr:RHS repeat-associated core domain-containing protein [Actinomycetota bacterium]
QHANAHGDIVGTTDTAGTWTPVLLADEYGATTAAPASRLGWLGKQQRFTVGGALGLVRMGVRLYDPRLGRFLQTDPIEGGSANNYDYVAGDPVNKVDLDGQICWSCHAKKIKKAVKRYRHGIVNFGIGVAGASVGAACVGTVVCGLALAGVAGVGFAAHLASDRAAGRDGRGLSLRGAAWQATVSAFSGGLCGKIAGVGCGRGAFAPGRLRGTAFPRFYLGALAFYTNFVPKTWRG